jgi:argininosuccinate lyase
MRLRVWCVSQVGLPSAQLTLRPALAAVRISTTSTLMVNQGHDSKAAVDTLKNWLEQYRRDLGRSNARSQQYWDPISCNVNILALHYSPNAIV